MNEPPHICNEVLSETKINQKPNITMKKLLYSVAILLFLSLTYTSCTKEEVKPQVETNNTGGGVSDKF